MQAERLATGCAVLAVAHGGLGEGIRGLLATVFRSVVMVADEAALATCVESLHPDLVVVDLTLVPGGSLPMIERLRRRHPGLRLIVLCGDDEPAMQRAALAAGAGHVLLKRSLGSELMPKVDELMMEHG